MSSVTDPVAQVYVRREATTGWARLGLAELWDHRELLYFLVWRDIKVRYKQTVLGALWAILQPFLTMLIFSLFFGRLAKMPSDGAPYPLFAYSALVPWTLFATGVTQGANSVVLGSNMVKKIYFPRLLMPASAVIACLVDFSLAFIVLLGMMVFYGCVPSAHVLWLPYFLVVALLTAFGTSFWLAAMNAQFRDVRYIVPFLVQIWLFASPVAYPASLLSESWQTIYALNPMVGVVEGFRWGLIGTGAGPGPVLVASSLVAVALFLSGAYYFRRLERTFADVI